MNPLMYFWLICVGLARCLGVSDTVLCCAFVSGLPESVRQLLRAGARLETLKLANLVTRARSVMVDHGLSGNFAAVGLGNNNFSRVKRCNICNSTSHLQRDCASRERLPGGNLRSRAGNNVERR